MRANGLESRKASGYKELVTRVLTPGEVQALWPEMEPMVLRALEKGLNEITAENIYEFLREGRLAAFVAFRADQLETVAVVEQCYYPSYSVINVVCLAGSNLQDALYFLPALQQWALAVGAIEIRASVQTGMLRLLEKLNAPFHPIYLVVRCNLRGKLQ